MFVSSYEYQYKRYYNLFVDGITTAYFLVALAGKLDNRTDRRYTELKDGFGKNLILIVVRTN
jgi:hypothetical protein